MNDVRNDTEYSCVTVPSELVNSPTIADIMDQSNTTILYIAGKYQYSYYYYYAILHVAQVTYSQVQPF